MCKTSIAQLESWWWKHLNIWKSQNIANIAKKNFILSFVFLRFHNVGLSACCHVTGSYVNPSFTVLCQKLSVPYAHGLCQWTHLLPSSFCFQSSRSSRNWEICLKCWAIALICIWQAETFKNILISVYCLWDMPQVPSTPSTFSICWKLVWLVELHSLKNIRSFPLVDGCSTAPPPKCKEKCVLIN